ncbi:DNA ligase 4 [Venturia nashicola]|uniref:DNA ligase n=1 Tax=Venturia nashicola TaxID=86259 RepID=A0A4Z1P2Q7_9PEZI|nr:DNA ligase 4 [Venturia nashicola]
MNVHVEMQDADAAREESIQYGRSTLTEEEMNENYPNRPHNVHKTLLFNELVTLLFDPLLEIKKQPAKSAMARKKQGPHGPTILGPAEKKRQTVEKFFGKWRQQVGDDIYPVMRLMVPARDRDRAMYGLKEATIAKLFIKIIGIDRNSDDAYNLIHWKLPGKKAASTAGDFAGRCYEVLSKRPWRTGPSTLTIAEINEGLDKLSIASKDEDQQPILQQFYEDLNPEELMWLIRIILRDLKIGGTENTFFDFWHPDANNLFNISSNLRRVCWELFDPSVRLEGDKCDITLMQCFRPMLAAFQQHSFEVSVRKMHLTAEDPEFWIEEKLDGERIQLHMCEDDSMPGGMRFGFWSRKSKDYTYLYGSGLEDSSGALTQHLKEAFKSNVRNIILDGEMITWDMEMDRIVNFGTLKTAALSEGRNPYTNGQRPVFRVFDCLLLNNKSLTNYTLRDRRNALSAAVIGVHRRLEIHEYTVAQGAADIEPALRRVVAEASEGLVLKSPRSSYALAMRNDNWVKVKPEYMTEFGEALDCVVVGGYWGSGRRGNTLSSFMCGLRVDEAQIKKGANAQKCYSFFKVGGGMARSDYDNIAQRTEGKWIGWDDKRPPTDWIELAGKNYAQYEKPDVWIKPQDSVVLEVKAASVGTTDQFRTGFTLRFPRFKRLRDDKSWKEALSINEFIQLKIDAEKQQAQKSFEVDNERKQHRISTRTRKKPLTVMGDNLEVKTPYAGPSTKVFEGLTFFIATEALKPWKKTKSELEQMVKANGGAITQKRDLPDVVVVADRFVMTVRSIEKDNLVSIVRPSWIFHCIEQNSMDVGKERFLLPMEPSHMLHIADKDREMIAQNVDEFGDSYCRDITVEDLKIVPEHEINHKLLLAQFKEHNPDLAESPGWMFNGLVVYFDKVDKTIDQLDGDTKPEDEAGYDLDTKLAGHIVHFSGGRIAGDLDDTGITHVVVGGDENRLREICGRNSLKSRIPRLVTMDWIRESWKEDSLLDEESAHVEVLVKY